MPAARGRWSGGTCLSDNYPIANGYARAIRSSGGARQVEIKNMNSFSAIARAIDFEVERQVALSRAGRYAEVVQETRAWDDGAQRTNSMRSKGGAAEYRYFPEPDLPALTLSDADLAACAASMPEVPEQARRRRHCGSCWHRIAGGYQELSIDFLPSAARAGGRRLRAEGSLLRVGSPVCRRRVRGCGGA